MLDNAGAGAGDVSIHAPVKGRRRADISDRFSTYVSIHAPRPREGATKGRAQARPFCGVSIHAPVKGRRISRQSYLPRSRFQSTPP